MRLLLLRSLRLQGSGVERRAPRRALPETPVLDVAECGDISFLTPTYDLGIYNREWRQSQVDRTICGLRWLVELDLSSVTLNCVEMLAAPISLPDVDFQRQEMPALALLRRLLLRGSQVRDVTCLAALPSLEELDTTDSAGMVEGLDRLVFGKHSVRSPEDDWPCRARPRIIRLGGTRAGECFDKPNYDSCYKSPTHRIEGQGI